MDRFTTIFAAMNRRHAIFLTLLLLAAGIFFRPLGLVLGSAVSVDRYSHILLVGPISVILVYLIRNKVFAMPAYCAWGGWLYLLGLAAFSAAWWEQAALDHSSYISLAILLFAFCCIAAFLFCYGTAPFGRALFPLLFLLLMTPMPDWLLDRTIAFLQYGSAYATDCFFTVAGVPFVRDGVVISLPSITIEIAQECSGIRSSMVLFLAGLVLVYLFLNFPWTRLLATLVIVPLTILKNGLRIFTLTMLGTHVDISFLTGRLHHQGGIVFFAFSFAGLWAIIWMLQRIEGGLTAGRVPKGQQDSVK